MPQAREAAKVREAADLKKAKTEGDIAKLQQQLSALEEARVAQKAALQLQLEKEKLAKEVELQVGSSTALGNQGSSVQPCVTARPGLQ